MGIRAEKAMELFKNGYNCSQAVLCAFIDEEGFSIDEPTALRLASSFGGGMGRLREVCGAVCGAFMTAGMLYGSDKVPDRSAEYHAEKAEHYKLIQDIAARFTEKNGSIICRELLGLSVKKDIPAPSERTPEYYKKRPCVLLVGDAAEIIEKIIAEKNTTAI